MLRHSESDVPDAKEVSCWGTRGLGPGYLTFLGVLVGAFLVAHLAVVSRNAIGVTMLTLHCLSCPLG